MLRLVLFYICVFYSSFGYPNGFYTSCPEVFTYNLSELKELEGRYEHAEYLLKSKQFNLADRLLSELANKGYPPAQFRFGEIREKSFKDYRGAENWYLQSANQNYAQAQQSLAFLYKKQGKGNLFKEWFVKAENQYKIEANKGEAEGQYNLALLYSKQGDLPQSVLWFVEAASQGHKKAREKLSTKQRIETIVGIITEGRLFPGIIEHHNDSKSSQRRLISSLVESFKSNIVYADNFRKMTAEHPMYKYEKGMGFYQKKDHAKALRWFLEAAYQGHLEAKEKILEEKLFKILTEVQVIDERTPLKSKTDKRNFLNAFLEIIKDNEYKFLLESFIEKIEKL